MDITESARDRPLKAACRRYTLPGWHKWPTAAESRGALILPMGTIESTRDRAWTWILQSPMADVVDAGIDFDREVCTVRASRGDTATGGALEARLQARSLLHQGVCRQGKQRRLSAWG